ncbi:unnamed protein product [Darwinula stevensoni]|uniref:Retrotransposon gag domain-containing protein n=1 Tax=Darwinula stevensoni TaxID=69355 RepID=A0A7R9AGM5_9CRUS|nr:unnamed protein product [Darwinula stevensoni]CAG0904091.1 unnamed protein product [Darwinula stevensoni]
MDQAGKGKENTPKVEDERGKVQERVTGDSSTTKEQGENVLSFGSLTLIGSLPEFSGIRGTLAVREFVGKILQARALVPTWDDSTVLTIAKLKITGPAREFIAANEDTFPYKSFEELTRDIHEAGKGKEKTPKVEDERGKVQERVTGDSSTTKEQGENVLSFGSLTLIGSLPEFSGIRGTLAVREFVGKILQARALVPTWDDSTVLTIAKLKITGPAREFIAANEDTFPYKSFEELSKALIKQYAVPEDLSTLQVELSQMNQMASETVRTWGARIKGIGAKLESLREGGHHLASKSPESQIAAQEEVRDQGIGRTPLFLVERGQGMPRDRGNQGRMEWDQRHRDLQGNNFQNQQPISYINVIETEEEDVIAYQPYYDRQRIKSEQRSDPNWGPLIEQMEKENWTCGDFVLNEKLLFKRGILPSVEEKEEVWEQLEADPDESLDAPLFPHPTPSEYSEQGEKGTDKEEDASLVNEAESEVKWRET